MRILKIALLTPLFFAAGLHLAVAQTFTDGLDALQAGDADKAFTIWKPLADDDNPQAQYGLALLLETGGRTFGKNEQEAARLYQLAADAGVVLAKTNLGLLYAEGRGVSENPKKAAAYWAEASEAGHHMAQFNLGLSYYTGKGVDQDAGKAVELIQDAAFGDLPEAQFAMAQFYRLGIGVPKDPSYALAWYEKAAEKGNKDARRYAKNLKDNGVQAAAIATPEKPDETAMMAADTTAEPKEETTTVAEAVTAEPKAEAEVVPEESKLLVQKPKDSEEQASEAGTGTFKITQPQETETTAVDEAAQNEIAKNQELREQAKAQAEGKTEAKQPKSLSETMITALNLREKSPPRPLDLDEVFPQPLLIGQFPPSVITPKGEIAATQPLVATAPATVQPSKQSSSASQSSASSVDDSLAASSQGQLSTAPGEPVLMSEVEIPDGTFFVWLGTETSQSKAEKRWSDLLTQESRILPNLQPGVDKTKVGGQSAYRLFAGPLPEKALAWKICNAIKSQDPYFFCKAWTY